MVAVVTSAAAVALLGCSTSTTPEVAELPANAARVADDDIFAGALLRYRFSTGFTERARVVIRSDAQWAQAWDRVVDRVMPKPERPAVDFSREIVVLVAMGQRPSGGYAVAIDGVFEADGRLYVRVNERSPGQSCFVTAALTQPVDAVRVPRRDLGVSFVERSETVECR